MSVAQVAHYPAGSPGTNQQGQAESFQFTSVDVSGVSLPAIVVKITFDSFSGGNVASVACSAGLTGTGTLVKTITSTDTYSTTEIWAIPAPTGTGTVTVNFDASRLYQANLEVFSGADQTTPCPIADAVTARDSGTPFTITPGNLTADDAASGFGSNSNGGDVPSWTTGVETYNDNDSNVNAAGGYHLGTGSVSMSWGTDTARKTMVAVRVAAAAGGPPPPQVLLGYI